MIEKQTKGKEREKDIVKQVLAINAIVQGIGIAVLGYLTYDKSAQLSEQSAQIENLNISITDKDIAIINGNAKAERLRKTLNLLTDRGAINLDIRLILELDTKDFKELTLNERSFELGSKSNSFKNLDLDKFKALIDPATLMNLINFKNIFILSNSTTKMVKLKLFF